MSFEHSAAASQSQHTDARVVILAAGKGTRMKSKLAKVLHPVCGRAIIEHCVSNAHAVTGHKPVVVVSSDAKQVRAALAGRVDFAVQAEQLGTGHAVMHAEAAATGTSDIVVAYGDMPLIRAETMSALVARRRQTGAAVAMTSLITDNARGFGRVIRNGNGAVQAIVEEVSCTPEQLQGKEVNVGLYCFEGAWLWQALKRVQPNPQKGEYFLTDMIALAIEDQRTVEAVTSNDAIEFIGINTRVDLADAEIALRLRINRMHMLNGVTIEDPATTYIDAGVTIGADTTLLSNTRLSGATSIGEDCLIGPDTMLVNATIGARTRVQKSVVLESRMDNDIEMGPFARLRPGCHVHDGVKIGNFAEAKNSDIGAHTHMGHFSYMGDTTCGEHVNYSAGVITCNYDGEVKSRTIIGDHAFLGSDTMLVAPVTLGRNARTGAGAVVTNDVPDDTLAVGMPARVLRKLERVQDGVH
jgi:bifunctional UDP-N-acetylglucosamine pyrophosphorylase/glucosamine-1-phosphate N-acetyltransferase